MRALSGRSRAIIKKVLQGNNGIESRHLAIDSLSETMQIDPDTLHQRFRNHAPALATAAALRALDRAGLSASDLDALLISTCTGYLCPGLTSYVSERLGLRPDALLLDLVGQGCGAALPNLRTAEALIASGRSGQVLSICVEICSAAFYIDDDPGVLVSACLFGDGAGAAVLSAAPRPATRRLRWHSAGTWLSAPDRDYLRFDQRNGLLRNILARQVPDLAGKYAEAVLAETLQRTGVGHEQISTWILHAGGRDILLGLRDRLRLRDEDLVWSAGTLREYGNVSSASILFTMEAALQAGARDGFWWLSSFGAGFSCHGALLEVTPPG